MIKITKMHFANVAMPIDKEFVTYGETLTPEQEHQVCVIIGKVLMQHNINAEISTNAQLKPKTDDIWFQFKPFDKGDKL